MRSSIEKIKDIAGFRKEVLLSSVKALRLLIPTVYVEKFVRLPYKFKYMSESKGGIEIIIHCFLKLLSEGMDGSAEIFSCT